MHFFFFFQIQTRQWACNNARSITCNCGVTIRDHNDLIRFSCCGNPPKQHRDAKTRIVVNIPGKKCLAPGISLKQLIKGINSIYEVCTFNIAEVIHVEIQRSSQLCRQIFFFFNENITFTCTMDTVYRDNKSDEITE